MTSDATPGAAGAALNTLRNYALIVAPAVAVLVYVGLDAGDAGLSREGRATLAVGAWMALWWLTEAVPLAITAMLPLVAFPLLGIASAQIAAAPYAHPLIFLFLGGFLLGLGVQRSGLHRRLALIVLRRAGHTGRALVGAFMLATALLSMWVSNTATTIMLLPIAISLLETLGATAASAEERARLEALAVALLLGIAYSASIGGVATLIGTPPNLVLAAFVRERYGADISMLQWLAVGLPMSAIMLPVAWWYLTRIACPSLPAALPGSRALFSERLSALGPMQRAERICCGVFGCAIAAWILRPQLVAWTGLTGLTDTVIALLAGLSLFVVPVDLQARRFVMDWDTARRLPWSILLLFGGGLALAGAITRHGVDVWLVSGLGSLAGSPLVLIVLGLTALVVFLTEITSNTAVTATLLPVLAASATALGVPPGPLLIATALSASCAFMLPVATPPNAIVFSSGQIGIVQMARTGFAMNLVSIVMVTGLMAAGIGAGLIGSG